MAVHRGHRGLFLMNATAETEYGESGNTYSHWIRCTGEDPDPRPDVAIETDAGEQTGSEYPIHQEIIERSFSFQRSMNACSEVIALFGGFAWGRDAVTQPGGTDYLHAFTQSPLDERLGSFRCEYHADGVTPDADSDYQFRGCNLNEFELSGSARGLVKARASIIGSRTQTAQATPTLSSLRTNRRRYPTNKVRISIAACTTENESIWDGTAPLVSGTINAGKPTELTLISGDPIALVPGITSWRYRRMLNHDEETRFASGTSAGLTVVGVEPEIGDRRGDELEVTLREDDIGKDLIKLLHSSSSINNVEYAVMISGVSDSVLTDGPEQFHILMPICGVRAVPRSSGGLGIRSNTFTFFAKQDQSGDFYDPSYLWVVTDQSGVYNQAAA